MTLALPKLNVLRDRKYLDWLRTQPCVITGCIGTATDPAHIRFGFHGMGIKSPDNHVLPLRHDLHVDQHRLGEVRFWRKHLTDDLMMRALLALARERYAGWK